MVFVPEFAGQEDLFAWQTTGTESRANTLLVAVSRGGIDVAVSDLKAVLTALVAISPLGDCQVLKPEPAL